MMYELFNYKNLKNKPSHNPSKKGETLAASPFSFLIFIDYKAFNAAS